MPVDLSGAMSLDWNAILGVVGQGGWAIAFILLYRQMNDRVLRSYQILVKDVSDQLEEARGQRQMQRDDHIREVAQIHAAHEREYQLEKEHRDRCESRLQAVERALEILRGQRSAG